MMSSCAGDMVKVTPEEERMAFVCAICMERPAGVMLRPCGHNHFCQECAVQLFSCPFCRAPLLMEDGRPKFAAVAPSSRQVEEERQVVAANRTVISPRESMIAQRICLSVWAFIFIFGIVEHMHDIRQSCEAGDPLPGEGRAPWLTVPAGTGACAECSHKNEIDCNVCAPGYYNLGTQCFKYLENLPSMTTGAALGGSTYFVLIVCTQVFGIISEVALIRRMLNRKLMPRKELYILLGALAIEIARMFLVDIFVMQDYFGGRSYNVFREPLPCTSNSPNAWTGSDDQWYCDNLSPHDTDTKYYIAAHQDAWTLEENVCSTFTSSSSLLNFDEKGLQDVPGHTRFKTMGWIIGGEFALYYFFATFINEVADNMFVIPTTTSGGWLCKLFAISLEVFQLGALCPAAIFTHQDCLYYTDPLGVSLHTTSTIVIIFGYFIWSFVFLSLPLALIGAGILLVLFLLCSLIAGVSPCLRAVAACSCTSRCPRTRGCFSGLADRLEQMLVVMESWYEVARSRIGKGWHGFKNGTMSLAFLPMLIGGMFLGTLVIIGQGSKEGAMQVLTAIVLLSDVLFKIVVTAITEVLDYMLHRRVTRIIASGTNRVTEGHIVGQSLAVQPNTNGKAGANSDSVENDIEKSNAIALA